MMSRRLHTVMNGKPMATRGKTGGYVGRRGSGHGMAGGSEAK